MPKCGPKPKPIANRRYNPLAYCIRTAIPATTLFDQTAAALLQRACGEDADEVHSDSESGEDNAQGRRRSWTREQKLAAIKYATTTMIEQKSGLKQLISCNAAASDIGCTPKMLREWIKDQDTIYATPKGTRKH